MKRHNWSEEDDKKALFAYIFPNSSHIRDIIKNLPMSIDSFKMRIENFRYLDKGKGLSHCSEQTKRIFKKYKNAPKEEFELNDFMKL